MVDFFEEGLLFPDRGAEEAFDLASLADLGPQLIISSGEFLGLLVHQLAKVLPVQPKLGLGP